MKAKENQVIIRENRLEAESFIQQYEEKYLSAVNAVCLKLKSIGIVDFQLSTLKKCVSGNFEDIEKLFSKILETEKSKVDSNELRAIIESNMSIKFNGLIELVSNSFAGDLRNDPFFGTECQNIIEEIKNIRSRLVIIPKQSLSLFEFIELNDQLEPVVNEGKIRQLFSDIATPKQTKVIEAQKQAAKYLTEMSDALIANGQRHDFEFIMSFARKFFTVKKDENSGRFEVIPNTEIIAML
jgi:hypothetical protein